MWLSKLCASSGGIAVSGTTPRKGGHHSAGDHDLANSVIVSVRHIEVRSVRRDCLWVTKSCARAGSIGGPTTSTPTRATRKGRYNTTRNHDLADFPAGNFRYIKVCAIGRNPKWTPINILLYNENSLR